MKVLLFAEINQAALSWDTTAKAVTAATQLGEVTLLVCGPTSATELASTINGVERVLCVDDKAYAHGQAENIAELVARHSGDFSCIAAAATSSGKNVLPRIAALLEVMVISDVVEVLDANTFKRPIYAGNAIQTVASKDAVKVVSFRTTAFEAAASGEGAPIEHLSITGDCELAEVLGETVAESERPELSSARVVVSGGRGLGSQENFALIEQLADKFEGAVGASRAAVDSGFAPNDLQVGQTGKVVAPDLYLAVGISGAIQHIAGINDSKIIVAINKDEDAPIFQIADYGIVGDLFEVVPELLNEL